MFSQEKDGLLVKKAFAEFFVVLKGCVLGVISGEKGGCLLVLFCNFGFSLLFFMKVRKKCIFLKTSAISFKRCKLELI